MRVLNATNSFDFILISDCDFNLASKYTWVKCKDGIHSGNLRDEYGNPVRLSRFLLNVTSSAIEVDHRDRSILNNQRENIRICNHSQNMANRSAWNFLGFKGIFKNGKKYAYKVRNNRKTHYEGGFLSAKEAAIAYDYVLEKVFGDFALTNKKLGLL